MNALVPTHVAATVVDVSAAALERWADAGLIAPAGVDEHGDRMWDPGMLRRQISRYVDRSDDGGGEP